MLIIESPESTSHFMFITGCMCDNLLTSIYCVCADSFAVLGADQMIKAMIGDTVRLPCLTVDQNTSIVWRYQTTSTAEDVYIFQFRSVRPQYRSRFTLSTDSNGFILTIANASLNDNGIYTCIEDEGNGERHRITLDVHGPREQAFGGLLHYFAHESCGIVH